MFPTRFFCARFFASRFWPKVGADPVSNNVRRVIAGMTRGGERSIDHEA